VFVYILSDEMSGFATDNPSVSALLRHLPLKREGLIINKEIIFNYNFFVSETNEAG